MEKASLNEDLLSWINDHIEGKKREQHEHEAIEFDSLEGFWLSSRDI